MAKFDFLSPFCGEIVIDGCEKQTVFFIKGSATFEDVCIQLNSNKRGVKVDIIASSSLVSHVRLLYEIQYKETTKMFGDSFERGYADMEWSNVKNRQMFWYFFLIDEAQKQLRSFGVAVQPHSIVSFKIDGDTLIVDIDTQSGGSGVCLEGRKLDAATLLYKESQYDVLFDDMKAFMKVMMSNYQRKETQTKIYGFNNWYYAYGKSSYNQIIKDTLLLEELTKDISVRPYMVIDDGWSIYDTSGPWKPNKKFVDMANLAKEIKKHNIIPGIWFRPLKDLSDNLQGCRHPLKPELLDLSCNEVLQLVKEDVSRFVNWGYELIKFDFVTVDLFLNYGFQMDENLCEQGWRYKDNHLTNAELLLNLYKAIRQAAPNAVLIGCNAIPHLCAGIVEINRIGDDTSGLEWERTKNYGVNSLAFRLIQNNIFYTIDGDCVGITGKIPWKQNREWLRLLCLSGSPLFVSINPDVCTPEIKKDLIEAFKINSVQNNICYPIDWLDNKLPNKWKIDKSIKSFIWDMKR